jgi:class 3 adenylate cyclase
MTTRNEKPEIVRKLVIFSDICSSTTILEDLKATDNLGSWVNLLINLKENFIHWGNSKGIEMHKFIGDGWVFLAAHNIAQEMLVDFLDTCWYMFDIAMREEKIYDKLSRTPDPLGLTFGIDSGELIKLEMNEQVEYVGRPLNVAARLQGAAKEFSKANGVSGLISRSALAQLSGKTPDPDVIKLQPVTVSLKNSSGGQKNDCWRW